MNTIRNKYKLLALVFGISAALLFFFTNATTPIPQSFANLLPQTDALFSTMIDNVKTGNGAVGDYIAQSPARIESFNADVDALLTDRNTFVKSTDPVEIQAAQEKVRGQWIVDDPTLTEKYLRPISDTLRIELRAMGYTVLDPKIKPGTLEKELRVRITAANGPAALTQIGQAVNKAYTKYQTVTVIEPKWSLDPYWANTAGQSDPVEKLIQINLNALRRSNSNPESLLYLMYHEMRHMRNAWNIQNGIRDLDAGQVHKEISKQYLTRGYRDGFFIEEVPAWRLTLMVPDELSFNFLRIAHGLATASLHMKIELFRGLGESTYVIPARNISTFPGWGLVSDVYNSAKGTALISSDGFVIIADKEPAFIAGNLEEAKEFLRQSIAKSQVALEKISTKAERSFQLGFVTSQQYALLQEMMESNRSKFSKFLVGIPQDIFGTLKNPPATVIDKAKSVINQEIESRFGTDGRPQKMAAFDMALDAAKAGGADLGKPYSVDGKTTFSPAAVEKLAHMDRVAEAPWTGETWTPSEISTMPKSEISRGFERNLAAGMKVTGPLGYFLMGAEAGKALEAGNLSDFFIGTGWGFVKWGGITVGLQTVGYALRGAAAVNPIGAAVAIGATLGGLVNLTLDYVAPDDLMRFADWMAGRAPYIPVKLLVLSQNAAGLNSSSIGIETKNLPYFFTVKANPTKVITVSGPPTASPTSENIGDKILQSLGFSTVPMDLDPTLSTNYNFVLNTPSNGAPVNAATDLSPIMGRQLKVGIKLRYICSSWLFLATTPKKAFTENQNAASDPFIEIANNSNCSSFAAAATAYTQSVFDNSNIPVTFTSSWEIESKKPYSLISQSIYRTEGTPDDIISKVNSNGAMPAIVTTGLHFQKGLLGYALLPFSSTCLPFATNCDPNSSTIDPTKGPWKNSCSCSLGYKNPYPYFPSDWNPVGVQAARKWLETAYPVAVSEWTVNIAVSPIGTVNSSVGPDTWPISSGKGIFDAATGYATTDQGIQSGITKTSFFQQLGYIGVTYGSSFSSAAVAHQIGHLFGGLHERSGWLPDSFYSTTGLVNREAAAWNSIIGKSIMWSNLGSTPVAQFSSDTPVPPALTAFGDFKSNNRNQILRTLMFLTGNQLTERPTGIDPINGKEILPPSTGTTLPIPNIPPNSGSDFVSTIVQNSAGDSVKMYDIKDLPPVIHSWEVDFMQFEATRGYFEHSVIPYEASNPGKWNCNITEQICPWEKDVIPDFFGGSCTNPVKSYFSTFTSSPLVFKFSQLDHPDLISAKSVGRQVVVCYYISDSGAPPINYMTKFEYLPGPHFKDTYVEKTASLGSTFTFSPTIDPTTYFSLADLKYSFTNGDKIQGTIVKDGVTYQNIVATVSDPKNMTPAKITALNDMFKITFNNIKETDFGLYKIVLTHGSQSNVDFDLNGTRMRDHFSSVYYLRLKPGPPSVTPIIPIINSLLLDED